MGSSSKFACTFFLTAIAAVTSQACDLCGCYTPQLETLPPQSSDVVFGHPASADRASSHPWIDGLYGAVAEQFTHYGTVQLDGREVPNVADQHLESSITQVVIGSNLTSRFALQLNMPFIYRSFERPEGFAIDRGNESGLGDISLLAKFLAFHKEIGSSRKLNFDDPKSPRWKIHEADFTVSAVVLAGLKVPTGDTQRIKEEFTEVEIQGAPESGIHGHDLTLGTGSYDGILGAQTSLRYKNFFFEADTQFTLRGDGRHQYHFANDLIWSGGPGYYLIRRSNAIFGLQFVVAGEYKDMDRFRGKPAEDTGITSVFVGPRVVGSLGKISGEIAAELPVSIENTALQVVPDYRLRASVAFRF
jgi:hypothetical protein